MEILNIKDFIHLYLGCMVYKKNSTTINKRPEILTCRLYQQVMLSTPYFTVIPILRPLSDMTEAERKEFHMINTNRENKEQCEANNTKWLLDRFFDVFKLIESGLAHDKTKIKTL